MAGAAIVLLAVPAAGGGRGGETEIVFDKRALENTGIAPVDRNRRGIAFEQTARRVAAGTPDLLNIETMAVVGGGVFVAQAPPAAPAAGMTTALSRTP